MRHLDLFSGYGGFALPARKLGWQTIGFAEVDPYASEVLAVNFRGVKNYGDVTKIDFRQFNGEVDIITGGFPCQAYSVAGKRLGMSDPRGQLTHEFIRAIHEVQPKFFIGENVKGLLSIDAGDTLEMICEDLCACGYAIDLEVLNAKDYGVPQNRERLFIFGKRLDLCKDFDII